MVNVTLELPKDFEVSFEAIAAAGSSTFAVLLYLLVVSNIYPQDVLRNQYRSQCATKSYFQGGAFVFQDPIWLDQYLRYSLITFLGNATN